MKKIMLLSLVAASSVLLNGCWSSPGSIVASTTPIYPEDTYTIVKRNVSGRDSAFLFLTFPITRLDTDAALQDALKKTKADALINVTVDNSYFSLIIFSFGHTIIHGDAVKIKRLGKLMTE